MTHFNKAKNEFREVEPVFERQANFGRLPIDSVPRDAEYYEVSCAWREEFLTSIRRNEWGRPSPRNEADARNESSTVALRPRTLHAHETSQGSPSRGTGTANRTRQSDVAEGGIKLLSLNNA